MAKFKLDRNPVRAYQQGEKQGIVQGIRATERFALVALYNIADDFVSEEKQGELYKAYDTELARIMGDELRELNESGAKMDNIDYVLRKINELRAKYGLKEKM